MPSAEDARGPFEIHPKCTDDVYVKGEVLDYAIQFEVFQVDDFTADDEYVTGEQIAEGSLKWDGCCNINFQRWLHFCRPDQAQLQTGGLMAKLYELGASCFGPENFE
jgi:hypothetical protein